MVLQKGLPRMLQAWRQEHNPGILTHISEFKPPTVNFPICISICLSVLPHTHWNYPSQKNKAAYSKPSSQANENASTCQRPSKLSGD